MDRGFSRYGVFLPGFYRNQYSQDDQDEKSNKAKSVLPGHCHGSKIKEPIQENISKLYKDDKAVNYKIGEIRGAFSLTKKIN